MPFVRERPRKDGTVYYSAYFELADGTQTSDSYDNRADAEKVVNLVLAVGGDKALEILGIERKPRALGRGMTLTEYLNEHIDHLTGVDRGTTDKYRAYVTNDIAPIIGDIELAHLDRKDIAKWVQWMQESGALKRDGTRRPASAKTIANKHGFLSGALAAGVPKYLAANPAADARLPQGEGSEADEEMVFLTNQEFEVLLKAVTEYWRPMVRFLVASGCRFGEAAALRPTDINRRESTVRIRRSWTYSKGGYRLVKPKGKSRRTINVPTEVLDLLDYSHEWVFVNRAGGPVRIHGFHARVWKPAVKRSGLYPPPRTHDLRHTCASWMIAARVPLPVIQKHLGHESITTTVDTYGHLDRSSFKEASDAMRTALFGG
jgi:integrase